MKLFRRLIRNAPLRVLGPGLVTGAADDDPSGIATYSQAGARFGFNMLWSMVLTYPLMVGIQLVSARIGRVTGRGLAANIRRAHSPWLLYSIVLLLLVANVINVAADIAMMGEALRLVVGFGSGHIYSLGFGVLSLALVIALPFAILPVQLSRAGVVWLKLSVLYLVIGVAMGLAMGSTQDFSLRPVHAHVNLLGWTTLALGGLVYTVFPQAGGSLLAKAHFWLLNLSLPVMMVTLSMLILGNPAVIPLMAIAEIAAALGVLAFAANLFVNLKR